MPAKRGYELGSIERCGDRVYIRVYRITAPGAVESKKKYEMKLV